MAESPSRLVAKFDGWTLCRAPLELSYDDRPVKLQEQPLQVLETLLLKPGELVTREELAAKLWPRSVVDYDAGLNTAVRKLRAILTDDAEAPRYLETVPRQGYRFIAHVERADADFTTEPAVAADIPVDSASVSPVMPRRPDWRRPGLVLFGLAAAVAVAVFAVGQRSIGDTPEGRPARAGINRLAVLPFENLSPDPANAFFADGMHEELLSALGNRAPGLEVISRTTMMLYREAPTAVRALARDLGATHVLEGSVRREASVVRVSLQLIDARTDRQVWADSYQRTLVDAMTLQTQLAREVASQLAIRLPVARFAQLPPPRNPEAYDLWLIGNLAWQQVGGGGATAHEIERVEAIYTRAIALDDTYGAAYADRSRVRVARHASRADASETNVAGARADIALAQKYAGGTPHVLVRAAQLAFLVDGDLARALGLIEAAEQTGPLNADLMLTKGNFLMFAGRLEESLALHEQAAKLDPGNATIYRFWLFNLLVAHRPSDAMRVLHDYDSRFPGRLYRGEYLFAYTGSTARWWAEVERLRAADDPNATLSAEVDLLRYEQRSDELRARLNQADPRDFPQHGTNGGRVGPSLKPVAELRGWERLLAGDPRGAAREGRLLAAFVENLPKVAWNEWWRSILTAESALMLGENVRAAEHARAAIRLTSRGATFVQLLHVRQMSARVLAWCGEHDAAIDLLEKLARDYPGIGPAAIVRDPLFRRPLSGHSRWKRLAQALDAQIAENQRLLR